MGAEYYRAESENGDHIDEPSEDARRDTTRQEHDVVTETSIDRIARDLTIWMAARDFPGRPSQPTSNFSTWPSAPRGSGGRRLLS